ncbi:lipid droplet-associated protein [Rhodococcus sp. Z13]|uniref:Lipid droplet-associated protein n=1 Tax=Rhodococcus sacchari TaxID=2962047 RepID=A0ACD4DJ04_9NOCA|nr:lipid droplet-associated protein [Rhodococcus sp. Z13]UYP19969.1 lipid droplet-associated protein [Rhodococcus sp. Z13]
MIRPPFLARVAAGVAVTAYEETLKLPSTAVSLPMTTVSQILQTTMRVQQVLTSLAIKGDQVFEIFGAAPEETAGWATFDDDTSGGAAPATTPRTTATETATKVGAETPHAATGRFALYSIPPATENGDSGAKPTGDAASAPAAAPKAPARKAAKKTAGTKSTAKKATSTAKKAAAEAAGDRPEIVEYLDYDSLTLAQLRARLRTLSVEELTTLLDYENSHAARPPFVTMLSNRISTARNK